MFELYLNERKLASCDGYDDAFYAMLDSIVEQCGAVRFAPGYVGDVYDEDGAYMGTVNETDALIGDDEWVIVES